MEFLRVDPAKLENSQVYRLVSGSVVPRPIAWVSTISREGVLNLAPYSQFVTVCTCPPMLSLTMGIGEAGFKDTPRNILDTQGYVIHPVVNGLEEKMNTTSGKFPPEVSEFEEAGLTPVPSELVAAPRIAEAPVAMELEFRHLLTMGREPRRAHLIMGEVVLWHIREDVLVEDLFVDPRKLQPVGRLGGSLYCRTQDMFEMHPAHREPGKAWG